jgi:hypothetical protein
LDFMGLTPGSNPHSYKTLPHDDLLPWRLCPLGEGAAESIGAKATPRTLDVTDEAAVAHLAQGAAVVFSLA